MALRVLFPIPRTNPRDLTCSGINFFAKVFDCRGGFHLSLEDLTCTLLESTLRVARFEGENLAIGCDEYLRLILSLSNSSPCVSSFLSLFTRCCSRSSWWESCESKEEE